MMERHPSIPGPPTKAALALLERRRRRIHKIRQPQAPTRAMLQDSALPAASPRVRPVASTIGMVSQQLGLSLRAIRFYEEMGLITCGRGAKNSRVLDETAKRRLREIVELKALGLAISEIAELASGDAFALRASLGDRLMRLDEQRMAIADYLSCLPAEPTMA